MTRTLAVALIVSAVSSCGDPAPPAADTITPTTAIDTIPAPPTTATTSSTVVAAEATAVADRVSPPTTIDRWAGYPCNQWAALALDVGWPVAELPKLLRTMWRESRCQPEVRSTTSDSCLVQVNDIVFRDWRFKRDWPGFDTTSIFDPRVCLSVGRWLFGIDGWTPWRGGA